MHGLFKKPLARGAEPAVFYYLQCFVWQLLVCPLLELNIHSGVEGARVHALGGWQVDVLYDMGGHTLP